MNGMSVIRYRTCCLLVDDAWKRDGYCLLGAVSEQVDIFIIPIILRVNSYRGIHGRYTVCGKVLINFVLYKKTWQKFFVCLDSAVITLTLIRCFQDGVDDFEKPSFEYGIFFFFIQYIYARM